MSLTALTYLAVVVLLGFLCIFRGPFWGVVLCAVVYFVNPSHYWWGADFSQARFGMLAIAVTALGSLVHRGKLSQIRVLSTPYRWLVAFFVLSCLVSLYAVDSQASLARCYALLTYLASSYFVLVSVKDDRSLARFIFVIVILGAALGVEAYSMPRHGGRLEGVGPSDSHDANNFALLMASIVPLGIPCFFAASNQWVRVVVAGCLAFICNGIILANSRGAVLALGVACLSLAGLRGSWQLRRKLLILLFIGLAGFLYLSDDAFLTRFQTISATGSDRGAGRLDIWSSGMGIVRDHPLGVGGDGFRRLSKHYIAEAFLSEGERVPHNTYLLVLAEQGVIGLAIYLFFVLLCLKRLRRSMIMGGGPDNNLNYMICAGLMASMICHLVGSFFGDRLYYGFFYLLTSMILVCTNPMPGDSPALEQSAHG